MDEFNSDVTAKGLIVIPCSQQVEQDRESTTSPTSLTKTASCPFSLTAVSPNSPFLALTSNTACEVNCWDLDTLLETTFESTKEPNQRAPPLRALFNFSYDNPLQCMTYDPSGRYLATADGPECAIWDMSHISQLQHAAVHDADSIICSGHASNSRITCVAFQPEESSALLATVSNTGKVALFDLTGLRPGCVCGPCTTAQVDFFGRKEEKEEEKGEEAGTALNGSVANFNTNNDNDDLGEIKLFWISDNRLLVVIPGGDIIVYSVADMESFTNEEESAATVFSAVSSGLLEGSAAASPNNGGCEVEIETETETTLQPSMLRRLSVGENVNTSASFDHACIEYISSPLTPARGLDDLDSDNGATIGGAEEEEEGIGEVSVNGGSDGGGNARQEAIRPAPIRTQRQMKPPPPPLESLPPPMPQTAAGIHTAGVPTGHRKGNTPATPSALAPALAPTNTNTNTNANTPRRTNINNPSGGLLSEQRIQQLRDVPSIERGDWGSGVSGGGQAIPWIMTPPPGTGNMPVSPSSGTVQMPTMAMNTPVPVHMAGGGMVGGTVLGGGVQYSRQQQQQQQPVFMYPPGGGVGPAMPAGYGHPAGLTMGSSSPPVMHQYAQYPSTYPQYAYPNQQQQGYQQQHLMMMMPMQQPGAASGGVPMQMMTAMTPQHAVQPPPPTAPYPGSPHGGAAAAYPQLSSPRSPAGRSQQQQQQNRGGTGRGTAIGIHLPRQGWKPGNAGGGGGMRQQEMQASRQWAGVAPGYMAYQHGGASAGAPSCSAGGGASGGVPPTGVGSPRSGTNSFINNHLIPPKSASSLPAVQQQQQEVPPPMSSHSSGGSGGGAPKAKVISEKEAGKINNGNVASPNKQTLKKRTSKGSSSSKSSSTEAAAAAATAAVPVVTANTTTTTVADIPTPRGSATKDIRRNISEETDASIETHEQNNKNGTATAAAAAASAGGSGNFSNSSSLTPSPRQGDTHRNQSKPKSAIHGPSIPPLSAAPSPLSSASSSTPPRGAMPPQEPSSIIYLGNLPQSIDDSALYWTCSHFGPVLHVQIIRDKATQLSRGYGFVTFAHPAYARCAMEHMNGQMMYGPCGGQKIKAAPTYKKCMEGGFGA